MLYASKVHAVIHETHDSTTFGLTIPEEQIPLFAYRPGQFVSVEIPLADEKLVRCYSFSRRQSQPGLVYITVKRVPNGRASNWLNDNVKPGDVLHITAPAGRFFVQPGHVPLVLFAAGSGITPIFSILQDQIAKTQRHFRLFYANRDADNIIFRDEIDALKAQAGDRLHVQYHLDDVSGFPTETTFADVIGSNREADVFICGPMPFMKTAQKAADAAGIRAERIHVEQFAAANTAHPNATSEIAATVTLELPEGRTQAIDCAAGETILAAAQRAGLDTPCLCKEGFCGTCRAQLREGEVQLRQNLCLSDNEIAAGETLTCQAVPKTARVALAFATAQNVSTPEPRGFFASVGRFVRHNRMVSAAIAMGIVLVGLLFASPVYFHMLNPGPMTPGHEKVACDGCHQPAPGTTRQQLQANVAYWLGTRASNVAFGFNPPKSLDCIACHERPNDRHPVNRFREPRFVDALDVIDARSCMSCHVEHKGERAISRITYCSACHERLTLKNDPVDTPHAELVATKRWDTCLGCHDFHGNHKRSAQKNMSERFDHSTLTQYLRNGTDPYAAKKTHVAKEVKP